MITVTTDNWHLCQLVLHLHAKSLQYLHPSVLWDHCSHVLSCWRWTFLHGQAVLRSVHVLDVMPRDRLFMADMARKALLNPILSVESISGVHYTHKCALGLIWDRGESVRDRLR